LDKNSDEARELAEAKFRKKQEQFLEGQKAMAEYKASRIAVRDNTARLRALRLAREAELAAAPPPAIAAGTRKRNAELAAAQPVAAAAGARRRK
jgi:hypothetical protein